jgi:hypothetical protein
MNKLTPAFEVNYMSHSALQGLIHWHESHAQALGPKAMHDDQARAEQLKHRKWVNLLIMAALRAGHNESVGKYGRTASDDLRSAPVVGANAKRARLVFVTLGVVLLGAARSICTSNARR